ncbi:FG-GAP-like repeat-containing protein [Hyalangium versicolor]|uniref:FG-GAP-like repeat-containing protein n=1 Tax=Hyalangium versicolor TaxID=2861190 RepID=UPI001CCB0725|nr:FG-GAP-like repeat-containing protein [Hyalangium versicolor]
MVYGRGTQGRAEYASNRRKRLFAALAALSFMGACDSTSAEDEARAQGTRNLEDTCEVRPPFTPHFEPALQWAWTGSPILPEYNQVMMTPAVADVNQDGIPDIIFSSFRDVPNDDVDWKEGVLRAISGNDGHDLWAVTDPAYRIKAAASIAVGDIDNDGKVEICGIPTNGRGIICYENDGTFKFRSAEDAFDYNEWGGPSLADLDGDGTVEILDGNRVYSNTGTLKWVGSDGMGGAQYTGPVSFAVDIDNDGKQEVINGRSVYRFDGSLKCANTDIPSGLSAAGNFDGDTKGEIVVSGNGKVSLLDDNCTLLWSKDIPGGCSNGCGGGPTLADVDHDGLPEIAVVGDNALSVLKSDGTVKWTSTIQDWSSGKSGATVFDFEDDGNLELVYADEVSLRIYNAATGAVRYQTKHSSGTTHENPVIADVDGDFAADLVVATNDLASPAYHGIRVYHDTQEGWAHTRRIWNQHAYSVTNVNNDGTIPAHPVIPWQKPRLNTFRSNVAGYVGEVSYSASDLIVQASSVIASCGENGTLVLSARVTNGGTAPVAAGLQVAFYRGNPASGGTLIGVATLADALPAGDSTVVSLSPGTLTAGSGELFVIADDNGSGAGSQTECDEANNSASATVDFTCTPPPPPPPENEPPVALCKNVTVTADAQCHASASVNNGSYDPDNQPGPFSVSESPAGPFGSGQHSVTLTASDGDSSAQCVGTVTVVDTTKPVITCPISVDASISLGQLSVIVNFAVSASDTCGPTHVTCNHPPGTLFIPGLTPVTCTATDTSGNTASCQFGVRVSLDLSL